MRVRARAYTAADVSLGFLLLLHCPPKSAAHRDKNSTCNVLKQKWTSVNLSNGGFPRERVSKQAAAQSLFSNLEEVSGTSKLSRTPTLITRSPPTVDQRQAYGRVLGGGGYARAIVA
ncbi:hypothetical protein T484DRAFT_2921802 [Baffinella frigidus]|nr:hypothetical protein T484DRAFT_2921802 [Cryptophyta sp. CCMP2293]